MTRIDETYIQFCIEDYPAPNDDRCVLIFTTEARADYLLSCVRFGHYVGTRWFHGDDNDLDANDIGFIESFIGLVERDLIMSCDADVLTKLTAVMAGEEFEGVDYSTNGNIARVATALESLNEKTPELITLQDLLDDLSGNPFSAALSEFVPIFELLTVLGNLFPSLKFKVNATELFMKIFEHFSWKSPILGLLTTMNVSLAGMALGALGSGAASFMQLLGTGSENAAKLWYNTINGAGNFFGWWDSLYDWWNGTGGTPPADEEKSMIAKVYNDVFVEGSNLNVHVANNVSCGCGCGGSGFVEPEAPIIGGTAPDGYEWPATGEVDEYECKAAHFVYGQILDITTQFRDDDVDDYAALPIVALGALVTAFLASGPIGWTIGISATIISYLVVSTAVDFANIVAQLTSNKDAIICAIIGKEPADAEIDFLAEMSLGAVEEGILSIFMTNHLMNLLIVKEAAFYDEIMAQTVDCVACPEPCVPAIVFGTGNELQWGVTTTLTSVWLAGPNRYYLGFGLPAECDCVDYSITITNCSRSSGWTGGNIVNCVGSTIWSWGSQTNPNGVYTAQKLDSLSANASFTMDVLLEEI